MSKFFRNGEISHTAEPWRTATDTGLTDHTSVVAARTMGNISTADIVFDDADSSVELIPPVWFLLVQLETG